MTTEEKIAISIAFIVNLIFFGINMAILSLIVCYIYIKLFPYNHNNEQSKFYKLYDTYEKGIQELKIKNNLVVELITFINENNTIETEKVKKFKPLFTEFQQIRNLIPELNKILENHELEQDDRNRIHNIKNAIAKYTCYDYETILEMLNVTEDELDNKEIIKYKS